MEHVALITEMINAYICSESLNRKDHLEEIGRDEGIFKIDVK
jgi:hypothetical protein